MPGHVIRRYREMKNFSQKYVAAQMGISQNAYSKIENNITQLTVQHVKELAKILEVPMVDLLSDDFEIHRPYPIHRQVTKVELVSAIERLKRSLDLKHASRHESYMVAMSLLKGAEQSLEIVH